jgi:uncharacterized protein (TIGR02266 family)
MPGMRVTYEDAAGRRVETEALDVSAGGLFLLADEVIAVGKRVSVDITLAGGSSKWTVLARVIWVRERGGDAGPAGMGMKLIDADENMVAAISKLVAAREATDPGTGGSKVPARERTVLGVGKSDEHALAATPIVAAAPARERTQLGIGVAEPAAAREGSIPIELVAQKKGETELPTRRVEVPRIPEREPSELEWEFVPKPEAKAEPKPERRQEPTSEPKLESKPASKRAAVEAPPSEASLAEAGVPRRRGGTWVMLLLLLAIGGVGYAFRSRIMLAAFPPAPQQPVAATSASAPPPATASVAASVTSATPPPSVAPSASNAPLPSASASAASSSAPRASASASASASAKPRKPPAVPASGSAAPRHSGAPSGDNPY